jgi:hypothetical protein
MAMIGGNFLFLVFAAVLGWWLRGDPTSLIGDNRPVSHFSALQLLVVAGLAMAIYHGRKPDSDGSHLRQPRLVWLLIALGFCFLTADQLFDIHERTDSGIHALFHIQETAWTDRLDDLIVASYGLCGLGVLAAYRRELAKFFGIVPFLAIGFVFFGLSAACDVASNRPDFIPSLFANPALGAWVFRWVSSADQVFTQIAECFFASGFYYGWRLTRRVGRVPDAAPRSSAPALVATAESC